MVSHCINCLTGVETHRMSADETVAVSGVSPLPFEQSDVVVMTRQWASLRSPFHAVLPDNYYLMC